MPSTANAQTASPPCLLLHPRPAAHPASCPAPRPPRAPLSRVGRQDRPSCARPSSAPPPRGAGCVTKLERSPRSPAPTSRRLCASCSPLRGQLLLQEGIIQQTLRHRDPQAMQHVSCCFKLSETPEQAVNVIFPVELSSVLLVQVDPVYNLDATALAPIKEVFIDTVQYVQIALWAQAQH